jgi:hypothetical protein
MFYHKNPTASPAKHVLYLLAATVLGLLLSLIAHALLKWLASLWKESGGGFLAAVHPWRYHFLVFRGVGDFFWGVFGMEDLLKSVVPGGKDNISKLGAKNCKNEGTSLV